MSVCNLFKTLSNPTGNFLLFSQYADDLTRMATHSDVYKVVPSKFVVLNIDYSKFNNISFPNFLQNKFENGCAYIRSLYGSDPDKNWTPEISRNLFWNAMFSEKVLTYIENSDPDDEYIPKKYCKEIKGVYDINIYNYNKHNEVGYSEIYCFIPTEAKSHYIEDKASNDAQEIVKYPNEYVMGYSEDSSLDPDVCDIRITKDTPYQPNATQSFAFEEGIVDKVNKKEDKFEFNTIIVLYDVYIKDEEGNLIPKHKNIPMGIHLCGLIEKNTTTNKNIKFVSNPDIYSAGTSYGLRICSRFVANSSNITAIDINNIEVNDDSNIAASCIALGEVAKTMNKLNELISEKYEFSQTIKELLSNFKNSKTNVPYIKYINKEPYWFVNGKNTGVKAVHSEEITNYSTDEINIGLDKFESGLNNQVRL